MRGCARPSVVDLGPPASGRLRTRLACSFDVPATDFYGESLRPHPVARAKKTVFGLPKYCRGLDRSDGAYRDFRNVHALYLAFGDDGIAFAMANFSYPHTCPTSAASNRGDMRHSHVVNRRGDCATDFRLATTIFDRRAIQFRRRSRTTAAGLARRAFPLILPPEPRIARPCRRGQCRTDR